MDYPTIREAVAVFDDAAKLEDAVSELQSNGIDRSELSFLAHPSLPGHMSRDLRQAADDPATPRAGGQRHGPAPRARARHWSRRDIAAFAADPARRTEFQRDPSQPTKMPVGQHATRRAHADARRQGSRQL